MRVERLLRHLDRIGDRRFFRLRERGCEASLFFFAQTSVDDCCSRRFAERTVDGEARSGARLQDGIFCGCSSDIANAWLEISKLKTQQTEAVAVSCAQPQTPVCQTSGSFVSTAIKSPNSGAIGGSDFDRNTSRDSSGSQVNCRHAVNKSRVAMRNRLSAERMVSLEMDDPRRGHIFDQ